MELQTANVNEIKGFTKTHKKFGKDKKEEDPILKELMHLQRESKLTIGYKLCEKQLKKSSVEKIYLSNNCKDLHKKMLSHYSKLLKIEIIEMNFSSSELAQKLQKQFLVNVIFVKKQIEQKKISEVKK